MHRATTALDGVLVEEMIRGGREFVIGMSRDPQFGPVVMFGLGGVLTEALQDVVFGVAASGEQASPHVLANAIVHAARDRGLALELPVEMTEQPGAGVRGRVGSRLVAVGKRRSLSAFAGGERLSRAQLYRVHSLRLALRGQEGDAARPAGYGPGGGRRPGAFGFRLFRAVTVTLCKDCAT